MIPEHVEVLRQGDDCGNGMLVRFRLPSGLAVYGLATENFYGGHWDLGPTWNYVVMTNPPFLVDAGRRGQGRKLIAMLETAGLKPGDLGFVLISHGHEDHDGGLGELAKTGLKIRAHRIYQRLIQRYPAMGPNGAKQGFPAKCWHCFMPESFFSEYCLDYHRELQELKIDPIGDGISELGEGLRAYHLPGHSPDSLAIQLGDEAIIMGDIVLPDISPWPTREALFDEVAGVVGREYENPGDIFGLQRYIKSLLFLAGLARSKAGLQGFPAHRLFYKGKWSNLDTAARTGELIDHHVQRCGAIVDILADGPRTAAEIARNHFAPELLKGFGRLMAENEIDSHCELLVASGDVAAVGDHRYESNGSTLFENYIESLSPHSRDDPGIGAASRKPSM